MAVSLSKGGNISLDKAAPGVKEVIIGLGWDQRITDGMDFDLDASVFMADVSGKVRNDEDLVFYNHPKSPCGSVEHMGDNRTGAGEGDDKSGLTLSTVPADVDKIAITVTIHEAEARQQNFGQIYNAFIRIINIADNQEICRYDLTEDYSIETAMIFGELYRHDGEWKFRAVGQGYEGGLSSMAQNYGVHLG